jgi:hypothetical protein
MDLSEHTLLLLRDEAYVFLCREALEQQLAELDREKQAIEDTRPPFGVFARRETRDAFTRSMQTANETEAALRDRVFQLKRLDEWIKPKLHDGIAAYLEAASPEYGFFASMRRVFAAWRTDFAPLPELATAFAREVKGYRELVAETKSSAKRQMEALAHLRNAAVRLESQAEHLCVLGRDLAAFTGEDTEIARDLRLPALPNFHRVAWVDRLALLPAESCIRERILVENEARAFVAAGNGPIEARLEASESAADLHRERFLESYWMQLRAYAQTNYVEERDVDSVLAELAQRYVQGNIAERQADLSRDVFEGER